MNQVPEDIKKLVQAEKIILSKKSKEFVQYGFFTINDLIHSIFHGRVYKKERDELEQAKYKYTIVGPAISGELMYSCGKIITYNSKKYFIITFHEVR